MGYKPLQCCYGNLIMYYILDRVVNEIEISRSNFITLLIPITSSTEVKGILESLKKEYPKATHYCYAYVIDNYVKFSDDGEPQGTAGKPMLGVLESKKINNVLAVVIRYFGGIKLGAGGLLRAYVNSVSNAIEKASIYEKKELDVIKLTVPYKYNESLFYYLNKENFVVKGKEFIDKIYVTVSKENMNIEEINEVFNGNVEIEYLPKEEVFVKVNK